MVILIITKKTFLFLKNVYQSLKKNDYFILDLENYYRWWKWFLEKGKLNDGVIEFSSTLKQSNNREVATKIGLDLYKMKVSLKIE